jgi:hypothetical protein
MFLLDTDRNKFYKFIYDHLKSDGYALIISMGDGVKEFKSNVNKSFKIGNRIKSNNNKEMNVVETSCCIKNKENIIKEIQNNKLKIISVDIVDSVPNFDKCISIIVKKIKNTCI